MIKYSRLIGSKDGKILVSNFLYLTLMQVAGFIFPLLTLPYLAKIIGTNGFGRIAFASAVIIWLQTISDWGFNYTATRNIARNRDDKQIVSKIFSSVFWARCVLMIFSLFLLVLLFCIISEFKENADIILVTFLMIPGNIMFSEWFFQGIEKMKYITFLNLLAKFFFTICIFLFVKDKDDYILQPLFVSLGFISSGFIALYIILFRWEIQLTRPVWTDIRKTIKDSTNVFINNLMPNMYNSMATRLLGFFSSETMVGIYSSGKNFVSVSNTMLAIISRTFFPYLSRKENKHRIYAKISICITLIVVVALFVLAPFIIHLFYTEDFSDSIKVLRITSISLLFITLNNVYGTNYLLIHNCDKLLRNIVVVASLTGFLISFPLIYYWGYIGASLTFLFTSMMLGTLSTCFAIKVKRNQCK